MLDPGTRTRSGWYHGWNIVGACALAQVAANGVPTNAFSLFLRPWAIDLHTTISTLQLCLAACVGISALLSPITGMLADKYPARWLFGAGLIAIALFCFGVSFATSPGHILALYSLLFSVALSIATAVPSNAVISRWFGRKLGLALGLSSFGPGLGSIIVPPLVALALPVLGWRAIWQIAGAVIGFVIAPLVIWAMRDRPTARDGFDYLTGSTAAGASAHHGGPGGPTWRVILGRSNFWLLLAVYLPMLSVYGAALQNLAPIAASRGMSTGVAGVLLSLFGLLHVLSALIMGLLSDRFGNKLPLIGLAVAAAAGGVVMAFAYDPVTLGIGVMLVGFSGGLWPLLAAATAAEFGPSGCGRAFGLLTFFLPVIVLTPALVARLQENTGSYVPGLTGLATLTLLGGAACLLMRENRTPPTPHHEGAITHEGI
jgi:MFS family permease